MCLVPAGELAAQDSWAEREHEHADQLADIRELMNMLEQGMAALDRLDRPDLHDAVREVAAQLSERIGRSHREANERHRAGAEHERERTSTEREIVEQRLEVLRLAFGGVAEAGKREVAGKIEHAIHAYELMLEGQRGEDARHVRETAPEWFEEIELLGFAAHVYTEFDMQDRAERILTERDRLWPGWRERNAKERERSERSEHGEHEVEREPDSEHNRERSANRDRELQMQRNEMMRMAMDALLEIGRKDTVELLKRAIHAMEVNIEGREDREVRAIRDASPSVGQQIEILLYASKLWGEFGHERKAAMLGEYAQGMLKAYRERQARREGRTDRERERVQEERRRSTDGDARLLRKVEELQKRVTDLDREIHER